MIIYFLISGKIIYIEGNLIDNEKDIEVRNLKIYIKLMSILFNMNK